MKKTAVILAFLVPLASLGCKKSEPPPPTPAPVTAPATTLPAPVGVGPTTLGNAIGPDKRVTAPSETFGAKDTIYASVETSGTGRAKLRALWSYVKGEQTTKVDETTIEIDATGPAVNEFHISKPSGWPKGDYRVEIFLNDSPSPASTKSFKVS
jgi:hypothetical protein